MLLLVVSACQQDKSYRQVGIGTKLYTDSVEAHTHELETYFGYICYRAGLATHREKTYPYCRYTSLDETQWRILVHSGFNDIDQRCDAYLAWLDDIRAREAFGTAQIGRMGTLANVLVSAIDSKVSSTTLNAISVAFGFARDSFQDYHQLIYRGIESSTIKSIVSERRLAFRKAALKEKIVYRPDAVYLLRNYLRICMPYTITMDANTYARALVTGQGLPKSSRADNLVGVSVRAAKTARSVAGTNGVKNSKNIRKYIRDTLLQSVQANIFCVEADGFEGKETKSSILIYESWKGIKGGNGTFGRYHDDEVDDELRQHHQAVKKCDLSKYINPWENANYSDDQHGDKRYEDFVEKFNKVFPEIKIPTRNQPVSYSESKTRHNLAKARKYLIEKDKLNENLPDGRGHITEKLRDLVFDYFEENKTISLQ